MLKHAAAALLVILSACSPSDPKVAVYDTWARETGPSDSTAAYATIVNGGGADRLLSVRSTSGMAMLHETTTESGVMRMRPIDAKEGLSVPSNGKLQLAPGGAHVMLTGLKAPLRPGDEFALTLMFAKSKPQRVIFEVRAATR